MLPVRETLVHRRCVEIPDIRPVHHVQAKWTEDAEVDRCVHLLHEASSLAFAADSAVYRPRPDDALHDEFPSEG